MTEPIYTTYEIGYEKWASIDYFICIYSMYI